MSIVTKRVGELATNLQLTSKIPDEDAITKVVTIFRELRAGQTLDGKNKVKTPSGVLSTAEAISLLANTMALAGNFGDGVVGDHDLASGLQGAVVKDDDKDIVVWKDYLANVMKKHGATWRDFFTLPARITLANKAPLPSRCQRLRIFLAFAIFLPPLRGTCVNSSHASAPASSSSRAPMMPTLSSRTSLAPNRVCPSQFWLIRPKPPSAHSYIRWRLTARNTRRCSGAKKTK